MEYPTGRHHPRAIDGDSIVSDRSPATPKGRGAHLNPANRFEHTHVEADYGYRCRNPIT